MFEHLSDAHFAGPSPEARRVVAIRASAIASRRRFLAIGSVAASVALASVALSVGVAARDTVRAVDPNTAASPGSTEFETNRAKWDAAGIRSYSFTFSQGSNFLSRDVHVTVTEGKVTRAVHVPPGDAGLRRLTPTVDDVWEILEDDLAGSNDTVDVKYHPTYGFPEVVRIDPDRETIDEGRRYRIHEFEVDASDPQSVAGSFAAARRQWDSAAIDSYSFTFTKGGMLEPQPTRVTVKNNKVIAVAPIPPAESFMFEPERLTIDDIWQRLADALAREPHHAEFMYNATYGFPERSFLNPERTTMDDEVSITIEDFESNS